MPSGQTVGALFYRRVVTIDRLIVVTGAGASRELGAENRPLPLMKDWCDDLVNRLVREGPSGDVPGLLGLTGADGEQFETRLGRFLAWQLSLDTAGSMTKLGVGPGQPTDAIDSWFRQAKANATQIFNVVHRSLTDLFGQDRISQVSASAAYRSLLDRCGVTPGTPLAYVTTNYDVAGELALEVLGRRPVWGAQPGLGGDSVAVPVDVAGIAHDWGSYHTPVLHLHGRVGWYVSPRDKVLMSVSPRTPYQPQIGAPGLLLPDPDKNYGELSAVGDMWIEFENLLNSNAKVLVVGHSLHDAKLVELLGRYGARVGAAFYSNPTGRNDPNNPPGSPVIRGELDRIRELLPSAITIPMRFGPEFWTDDAVFDRWRDS